ncbi:hypothetical protein EMCRGX_G009398 [Ephydatia muelleri]
MDETLPGSQEPNVDLKKSKLVQTGDLQYTPEGTIDDESPAVQSGEVLIRQDGQLDGRSKAVRRGEVHMKT